MTDTSGKTTGSNSKNTDLKGNMYKMSQKMWNLKGDASTVSTDSSGKSLLSLPTSDKTAPQTRSLRVAGVIFSRGEDLRLHWDSRGRRASAETRACTRPLKARGCIKYRHVILESEYQLLKCAGFPSRVECKTGRRQRRECLGTQLILTERIFFLKTKSDRHPA